MIHTNHKQDKANPLAMILSAAMMLRYDLAQPKVRSTSKL